MRKIMDNWKGDNEWPDMIADLIKKWKLKNEVFPLWEEKKSHMKKTKIPQESLYGLHHN